MTQHCCITDGDGDTIEVLTGGLGVAARISIEDHESGDECLVVLERNQLLELKKAVDAAYKVIDT